VVVPESMADDDVVIRSARSSRRGFSMRRMRAVRPARNATTIVARRDAAKNWNGTETMYGRCCCCCFFFIFASVFFEFALLPFSFTAAPAEPFACLFFLFIFMLLCYTQQMYRIKGATYSQSLANISTRMRSYCSVEVHNVFSPV